MTTEKASKIRSRFVIVFPPKNNLRHRKSLSQYRGRLGKKAPCSVVLFPCARVSSVRSTDSTKKTFGRYEWKGRSSGSGVSAPLLLPVCTPTVAFRSRTRPQRRRSRMVFHHFPILPNAVLYLGTLPFFNTISYRIVEINRLNFQIFMTEIMEVLSRSYKKRPQRITPSRSLRILFFTLWLKSGVRNDTRTDMQRVTNQANFFRIKWLFSVDFQVHCILRHPNFFCKRALVVSV